MNCIASKSFIYTLKTCSIPAMRDLRWIRIFDFPFLKFFVNRKNFVAGLNRCYSAPGNHHKRNGHLVFNRHGGHGFHGQHLSHAVCHIYLPNRNTIKKMYVTSKEDQVALEINFRDGRRLALPFETDTTCGDCDTRQNKQALAMYKSQQSAAY